MECNESQIKGRMLIVIPEKKLEDMFRWLRKGTDGWATRTYLLKNLEVFDENLELKHLVGFNIYFKSKEEIDILFNRNGTYYLVETKQKGKYRRGWQQLVRTIDCFCEELAEHGEQAEKIVAVLATSSERAVDLRCEKLPWFTKEELDDLMPNDTDRETYG